jgi:FkbM family methyltransferase
MTGPASIDPVRWLDRLPTLRGWLTDLWLGLPTQIECRNGAKTVYLGRGLTLCRVLNRYRLIVPTHDLSLAPALMLEGRWEPWIGRLIARHVTPGMIVADVGANLGYFTMLMADRVGPHGRVHAFEPNAALAELIGRSAGANELGGRITIHDHALGCVEGEDMRLYLPGDHLGGAYVRPAGAGAADGGQPIRGRRLDHCPDADRIAFMKVDVEGYEPEVWDGMTQMLEGSALRIVLLEYTAGHYADARAFIGRIAASAFRLALVTRRRGPRPITPEALLTLPPNATRMLVLSR